MLTLIFSALKAGVVGVRMMGAIAVLTAAMAVPPAKAAGIVGQGTWETTLQGRDLDGDLSNGYEAYYDTVLDITWLSDANFAMSSGYHADGLLTWHEARDWVESLNVYGETGWRLPDNSVFDEIGWDVSSPRSELAHMFRVSLGNKPLYQTGRGLSNTGPFSNILPTLYWYGVADVPELGAAWFFNFSSGYQDVYPYSASEAYPYRIVGMAWAVRPGDVPEPQAFALVLAGLAMARVATRRQRA